MAEHSIRNNILASMYHIKALMIKHRLMLTQIYGADSKHEANLFRLEKSNQGIIGILTINEIMFASTLEHPSLKVPPGTYICKYLPSAKFNRNLYELTDIPERTECKFHVGNTINDTSGCILLGEHVGYLNNSRAVLKSAITINRFHEALKGEDLLLSIYDITNI